MLRYSLARNQPNRGQQKNGTDFWTRRRPPRSRKSGRGGAEIWQRRASRANKFGSRIRARVRAQKSAPVLQKTTPPRNGRITETGCSKQNNLDSDWCYPRVLGRRYTAKQLGCSAGAQPKRTGLPKAAPQHICGIFTFTHVACPRRKGMLQTARTRKTHRHGVRQTRLLMLGEARGTHSQRTNGTR